MYIYIFKCCCAFQPCIYLIFTSSRLFKYTFKPEKSSEEILNKLSQVMELRTGTPPKPRLLPTTPPCFSKFSLSDWFQVTADRAARI